MIHVIWGNEWVISSSFDYHIVHFIYKSINSCMMQKTDRKAKYIHIFIMNCIGFFRVWMQPTRVPPLPIEI